MLSFSVLSSLLLALSVTASPIQERDIEKRHSNCFSYNTAGCQYGTTGRQGAVATVSRGHRPDRKLGIILISYQEVGTCSEIGIDILQQGGNAADGEYQCFADVLDHMADGCSYDRFGTLCRSHWCLPLWSRRCKSIHLSKFQSRGRTKPDTIADSVREVS